jgi:hypothetical protein
MVALQQRNEYDNQEQEYCIANLYDDCFVWFDGIQSWAIVIRTW